VGCPVCEVTRFVRSCRGRKKSAGVLKDDQKKEERMLWAGGEIAYEPAEGKGKKISRWGGENGGYDVKKQQPPLQEEITKRKHRVSPNGEQYPPFL